MAKVTFIQGDTISSVITIRDTNKAVINIAGGTVKFRIVSDPDVDLLAAAVYSDPNVTISDGAAGEATLAIARSVTKLWTPGSYRWEVEYIDSASAYSHTTHDALIIEKSVYSDDA